MSKKKPGIEDIYPLSPMQQGMLFHTLYAPSSGLYVEQLVQRLRALESFDPDAFARAWQRVVDRQPILRTAFVWERREEPLQVVLQSVKLPVQEEDWRGVAEPEQEERLESFLLRDREQSFELAKAPLLRLALFRVADDAWQLVLTYHHLLLDAWSARLVFREVYGFYEALRTGRDEPAAPVRPYREHIAWLSRQDRAAAETWWRRTLAGFTAPTAVGVLRPAPPGAGGAPVCRDVELRCAVGFTAALTGVARVYRLTPHSLTLGAWSLLLSRYSGEEDVVFGLTVSGRPADLPGSDTMAGLFINTLPLRIDVPAGEEAAPWLRRLQARQLELRQVEHTPLADIQAWSAVPRGTPLFESILVSENVPGDEAIREWSRGLEIGRSRYLFRTNYPLSATVELGTALTLRLVYDPERCDGAAAARLLGHFHALLSGLVERPQARLGDLPLLGEAERHQLLCEWNPAAPPAVPEATLHELFAARVRQAPEAVAAACGGDCLTYGELDRRANRLARRLLASGVRSGDVVGLCLERSLEMVVAILGVLKAGGAYVPLDPESPRERLASMLSQTAAPVVIATSRQAGVLPDKGARPLFLDTEAGALAAADGSDPGVAVVPGQIAYVIFTSGSTGTPKGVAVSHRNVVRLFTATTPWLGFGPDDVWTLFHSYAFDFSVWEIWGALLYGGRLVVVPYLVSRSPEAFHELLLRERVTVLNQTPSAFRQLVRVDETAGATGGLALRWVIFGGEALEIGSLRPWFDRHGDRRPRLVNMYGITETTVHVTWRPVGRSDLAGGSVIGVPIPDLRLYVLDRGLEPVPVGVPGEICVGGEGLSRGYVGRPDLTAERFVPDPSGEAPGGRLYRSGDLARHLPNGDLEYLGRIDHQVKIRGFRIELGEIETALGCHPAVRQAVVLARRDVPGEPRLVAYVVARGPAPATAGLRAFLKERLPEYMVPAAFVVLEALPLTVNGKADRRALPVPEEQDAAATPYEPPATPEEAVLTAVWAAVLGRERVGVHDNFFDLGGDSIRSLQVISKARERGLPFPLHLLFEHPTPRRLARELSSGEETAPAPALAPFALVTEEEQRRLPAGLEDALPASRLQAGMLFHSRFQAGSAVYHDVFSFHLRGRLDLGALRTAADWLAARHAALRTAFDLEGREPLQLVHRSASIPVAEESLAHLPPQAREEAIAAWIAAERTRPFEWSQAPLLRLQAHRREAEAFQLTVSFHHAIVDGWSFATLLTGLFRAYAAALRGDAPPAEPPAEAGRSFVAAERAAIASEESRTFWRERLAGARPAPLPRWPSPPPAGQHGQRDVAVPRPVAAGLEAVARALGVPLKTVLLAAHLRALAALTGTAEPVTGLVVNGRPEEDGAERAVGLFLNTVPLCLGIDGSWADLVRRAAAAERELLPHRRYPLSEMQRTLGAPPLETVFNFVHFHIYQVALGLEELRLVEARSFEEVDFPFSASFAVDPVDGGVLLRLFWDPALFWPAQGETAAEVYARCLEALAADPDARAEAAALLSPALRHQALVEWSAGGPVAPPACAHEIVAARAALCPGALAVVPAPGGEGAELTYGELVAKAGRLARALRGLGVGPERIVGLHLESSPDWVVAVLAILAAGGAYLPLDPGLPAERLAFLLGDSGAVLRLTRRTLAEALPASGAPAVCLEDLETAAAPGSLPEGGATPSSLAYTIYTSGSTGTPKGVLLTHGGLVNLMAAQARDFRVGPGSRVLQYASAGFDASVSELFVTLGCGATLCLGTPETRLPGAELADLLRERRISAVTLPPSVLAALPGDPLPDLRTLVVAGEACAREILARWAPGRRVVDAYGPTEGTVCATLGADLEGSATPPIGRPLDGVRVYVLDVLSGGLSPVLPGVPGELCFGGAGLARGYRGRPDLTAERFVPDPFGGEPGGRLYRTGDRVRHLPDGRLDYLGRRDRQVKVHGVRVELDEVESALRLHPRVLEAAVEPWEGRDGLRLAAWVVPDGEPATAAELRGFLAARLPEAMIPAVFIRLERLPLTANGKVDRRALPAPATEGEPGAPHVPPRGALEQLLAGLWQEILGVERVGALDDFFALGGDSIRATVLVNRLQRELGEHLWVRLLFESPSLELLAARLAAEHPEAVARRCGVAAAAGASRTGWAPLERVPGDPTISFAQQRLWFLDRLEPGNPFYNLAAAVRLSGRLDASALTRALGEIVRRHETLRATFTAMDGHPVQCVATEPELFLDIVERCGLPAESRDNEVRRIAAEEARRPFDLARGPLLRATLVRVAEDDHGLVLILHHIVADGWSMNVLTAELATLYGAFAAGAPSPLPELAVQYADFARWQRRWLQGEVLELQLAWWRERLAGAPPALELPADRPRPAVQTYRGAHHAFTLPQALISRLRAFGLAGGATLFMALCGAFAALLGRLGGQRDLCLGTPVAGRNRPEVEGLIGFFVNMLVLRADLSGSPSFTTLIERLREMVLGAFAHQDLPFEKLVEELAPQRDLSRSPLFQVLISLQASPASTSQLPGLTLRTLEVERGSSLFDLSLYLMETRDGLAGLFEYNTDLYDAATVERLAGHLTHLIAVAVARPDRAIGDLDLLSAAERREILVLRNATARSLPDDRIHLRIAAQAALAPGRPAVTCDGAVWTRGELNRRANRIAHHLRALGAGPEARIGLFLERSLDMVAALLGVLKAGSAYVPLDPALPRERLAHILDDANLAVLITRAELAGRITEGGARMVDLDADAAALETRSDADPVPLESGESLAYVLYTSGSTGRPKGVQIPHRALLNFLLAMAREPGMTGDDTLLAVTTLSFDIAGLEIYLPLLAGGSLVVATREEAADGRRLADLLAASQATVLQATPAGWRMLLSAGWRGDARLRALCGGEALPPDLAEQLARRTAGLWNLYGPTETTIWSAVSRIEAGAAAVPLGEPIDNTWIYLLDDDGQPVPDGVPGELCIGGAGLARGYLGRPELTAERFVPDALRGEPGARLYRTGDLVRRQPGQGWQFLGRLDHQVKLRGFRIELGDVEAALARHPAVRQVAAAVREDVPGDRRLVAYVVCDGEPPAFAELRGHLRELLPDYMVPAAFIPLDALPLTPNGKLDRRALPAPEAGAPQRPSEAPRTPVEEALARILAETLGLARVGLADNFFELGAHSLLATRAVARIGAELAVDLPVRAFFEAPTVAGLAESIEARRREAAAARPSPPLAAVPRDGELPLSFAQHRLWLADRLQPGLAAYNLPLAIRFTGRLDTGVLAWALGELERRHEALRTSFPERGGEPRQRIAPPGAFQLPLVDLTHVPGTAREAAAEHLTAAWSRLPFDLGCGPVWRAVLVRTGTEGHLLALSVHHIVCDGWSLGVLVRELGALYAAGAARELPFLPELSLQPADVAAWQRRWLQSEAVEAPRVAALELPADRPRPAVPSHRGGRVPARLALELAAAIHALAQRAGCTPFIVLLAAFATFLHRLSGQEDLVVGSPLAGRSRSGLEGLVGFLVDTLPLRLDLSEEPSFHELLGRVRDEVLATFSLQDLPLERLPLFRAVFALQNLPPSRLDVPGLETEILELPTETAKFDLLLVLGSDPEGIAGSWEYSADLFDPATVARFGAVFETLLAAAVAAPATRLAELEILTPAERHRLLREWNDTCAPLPAAATIPALFARQVRRTPDAVAVAGAGASWTYAELDRRAAALARRLRRLGVGPEARVGLALERSPGMVAAILGILAAGGAYVPLDPSYPKDRLRFMAEDSRMEVLVTGGGSPGFEPPPGLRVFALEDAEQAEEEEGLDSGGALSDGLAYLMYTSGSTGRPKGVAVTHRNVIRLVCGSSFARLDAERVFLQLAPVSFDASTLEIWGPLLNGGRVVLAPSSRVSLDELAELLARHAVDSLWLTAGLFHQMVENRLDGLRPVRQLLAGGDVLSPEHVRRTLAALPGIRLINGYGPTENTTFTCCHGMSDPADVGEAVPIGSPITNSTGYVLDRHLRPVPQGVAGELCTGGEGLARGYLGRPELTAERFVPDPFGPAGARLYRTGDLVRQRADGRLEFLGRIDRQVKIRGFRIEPGEVEAVLRTCSGVASCTVLAREDRAGGKRLVAYVVPRAGEGELPAAELRSFLAARLPEHMVPTVFVPLAELPLTANGKVDREALPAPARLAGDESAAPRTPAEELLARLWAEVLGLERVGVEDSFFALGGDSILALQVVARAGAAGLLLSARDLFENQTVSELAAVARWSTGRAAHAAVSGEAPLTPIQRWFFARGLVAPHHFNQAVLMEVREALPRTAIEAALRAVVAHHDALRLSYERTGAGWRQSHGEATAAPLCLEVDLSSCPPGRRAALQEEAAAQAQAGLDLGRPPLLRAVLFGHGAAEPGRLLLIAHHLIVDGVSWRILLEDLEAAAQAARRGAPLALPPKTSSFQTWGNLLAERATEASTAAEIAFWTAGRDRIRPLPVDHERGENTEASALHVWVALAPDETRQLLQEVPAASRTRIDDALLTACARAFQRWTGESALLIDLEGHGRDTEGLAEVDLSRTVGWFTSLYPVLLDPGADGDPGAALRAVKEQLRRVPRGGIGHGLLRYLGTPEAAARLAALPPAEASFNYLGQLDAVRTRSTLFAPAGEPAGPDHDPRQRRSHLFEIVGQVMDGALRLRWTGSASRHRLATVEALAAGCLEALREVIAHCRAPQAGGFTPSDFRRARLSQNELDRFLARAGLRKKG